MMMVRELAVELICLSRIEKRSALFYNIHTHHSNEDGNTLSVRSLYSDFDQAESGVVCSLGLHPWYLADYEKQFADLEQYAGLPNVLAIGECGLDRICDTSWDLQVAVFKQQMELANKLGKPLIVHCVRAFDELLKIIGEVPLVVPVIVHGFNKKRNVAERMIAKGIYLSFGEAIMNEASPAAEVLKHIPSNQFFLETDDADAEIGDIYRAAAAIRNISEEAVILQVQQNFNTVFKYKR